MTTEWECPDVDLDDVTSQEPDLGLEATRPFLDAAVVADAKLRATGFFVAAVHAPATRRTEPRRALVVEDDPGAAAVVEGLLKGQGFETRLAGSLQAVIRALSVRPAPDVILMDVLLPDASGFAILERLRRHPELGHVPVVMLTNVGAPADVAKGLALGASGYVTKPVRPQVLLAAVADVLGLGLKPERRPYGGSGAHQP